MGPSQLTKQSFEELIGMPLDDGEVAEMVSNLTMFIEMLAEIDQAQKDLSNDQHKAKE